MTQTLESLRRRLDETDRGLLEKVAERQAIIKEIAQVKQSTGFPLRDFRRERQVLEGAAANATRIGISAKVAEDLMRILIRYSLTVQERDGMSAHRKGNGQRALVIGGAGRMGGWFARFLYSQGFEVEISDVQTQDSAFPAVDWRNTALDHEYIVVATPMSRTNAILQELAGRRPRGVVFDVCSLKSPIRTGLDALRDAGVRVASVHPMFGDDVELLASQHVVFVDLGAGDALQKTRALFDPTMASQVVLDADSHDRMMAYVLGLAHAVNIVFSAAAASSGKPAPELLQISGTTFAAQFDVARRVSRENADLYYEIQTLNDFGTESLDALQAALSKLIASVRQRDPATFTGMMRDGLRYAGDRRSSLR